ncbi:MAG: radical SAM protein [Deltaproteobacteria bacterium]|jgi:7-carboxy-7-deazaguanine synthase|nr:radical SAM protein [Deltaproteobacteria bacterium]
MPTGSLRINEIFHSIQGESTWAGTPCVFVRLTGCHLRCTYCDTEYAFNEGRWMSIADLIEAVGERGTDLVQVTGGEPLLQPAVHELMAGLCDLGKTVLLETSGACDISACDPRVIRILDLKTPGSGEVERNRMENLDDLTERDEVKFVICDRADYDWACAIVQEHAIGDRCRAVLFSPVFEQAPGDQITGADELDPVALASWLLESPPKGQTVRMQLQMHKHIWDPQMRGV